MKHIKSNIAAIAIGLLGSNLPAQAAPENATSAMSAASATGTAVSAEILVKSDHSWNDKPYTAYPAARPQLTVMRMTIAAHTVLPWHTHAAPNAAYVLSGHLTVEDRGTGQMHTFAAGQAFNEQVGSEHRGFTGDEACTVIVTYAGAPGLPTSVPAPGEKPAY
jgi:quercetin dioxygenase-like cupin family protein